MKKFLVFLSIFLVMISSCSKKSNDDKSEEKSAYEIDVSESQKTESAVLVEVADAGVIADEKITTDRDFEILKDYCDANNFLIEGDRESGYRLYAGSPDSFLEISSLPGLAQNINQLKNIHAIYIYTEKAFTFDGVLFPDLVNLYIVSNHSVLKNVNQLEYLVLIENEACDLGFLSDCTDLYDLFIYSKEKIILPDLSKFKNLSTVSVLSPKQADFEGINSIPCDFNFILKDQYQFLGDLMMKNVDYSAFLDSNCKAFIMEAECYEKYLTDKEFVSFIEKMKTEKEFAVSFIE